MTKNVAKLEVPKDALIKFMENEWKDIHHSRIQEWSALGLVGAVHLILAQMPRFLSDANLNHLINSVGETGCLLGLAMSILGIIITLRHRNLMIKKIQWIYDAELHLGLVKNKNSPYGVVESGTRAPDGYSWKGLTLPRIFSTSGMILLFYFIFILIDVAYLWVLP